MPGRWDELYSLQDWTLSELRQIDHGLYLTGGTALSREAEAAETTCDMAIGRMYPLLL